MVAVTHDRFLDRVATHILAWEGRMNWLLFEGNFAAYEQDKIADPVTGRSACSGNLPQADPLNGTGAVMDDDALEVIRQAEQIVRTAGWHL